ncbi:MAG: hypothetical protein QNJ87_14415 [Gammaproteobacteria bacterium]|nr:hypothetical protein [Gammaproteobacteria bacterium]MDJ0872944.1 hypothetical protein [Gammaproteobacteria bacterium]MDJ0890576.1 hypothetical protein [Gammaproteobacteria bacterium]
MLYLIMGLAAATAFEIASLSLYGYQALLDHAWVDYVFWWLIGTGVLLAAVDSSFGLRCRICRRMPRLPLCASLVCR